MRPYYYQEHEGVEPPFRFSTGGALWPPVVKYVVVITAVCYIIQLMLLSKGAERFWIPFMLDPGIVWRGRFWQFVTYMLLHGSFWHIFLNMFILWMFGREVEQHLGAGRFLALYLLSGIAAGVCTSILAPNPVIGASGGVLGVLVSFGMLFPRRIVLFMLIIPMPAKVMVFLFAIIEILSCYSETRSEIACFAHLGGMAFGYLFVKTRPRWEKYLADMASPEAEDGDEDDGSVSLEDEVEMDRLLGKIKHEGLHRLTWREKRFLDRISRRLRNR